MRPEEALEKRCCDHAKLGGWRTYKLTFIGTRGAPDRLFGKAGHGCFIEFKRPGEEPTEQQKLRHKELRQDFGFSVHWTDNFEHFCHLLGLEP